MVFCLAVLLYNVVVKIRYITKISTKKTIFTPYVNLNLLAVLKSKRSC